MHRLNVATGKLQAVVRGADARRRVKELRIAIRNAITAQSGVRQRVCMYDMYVTESISREGRVFAQVFIVAGLEGGRAGWRCNAVA